MFDRDQHADEDIDPLKRPAKAKKFNGLLEWVLDQEGHEFLVEIDRSFIKNKENLIGLKEKLKEELAMKDDNFDDQQFNQFIKHLYKAARPTKENLADEKYFMFL